MENIKHTVVDVLEACSLPYEVSVYMNHVVVKLPHDATDFYHACKNAESQVINCVNSKLPQLPDDVLFCIKKDGEEHIFKMYKHVS